MRMDTDSVGYCRIRMWNQIEKANEKSTTLNSNTDIHIDI